MNQQPAKPRRLLLVTYYFPPSAAVAAYRMLGFARHLPACGWQVGVVAPPVVPQEPVDESLTQRVPPDTAFFSTPYPTSLPARSLEDTFTTASGCPARWLQQFGLSTNLSRMRS